MASGAHILMDEP